MIPSPRQLYRLLLSGLILFIPVVNLCAQARLILNNGGFVNITQGAYVVIDNPDANAITQNSSGHIISEGENNIVQWTIGTTAASYTIPWGFGTTNYIPVLFTTASAAGSGFFQFSTYRTPWNNSSQLPTGIATFTNATGADNSAYVLDRFWQINALSYTTKPTLTSLQLTYIDVEHSVASNTITETSLGAQRYNSSSNTWGDYLPSGTVNTTSNTVTIASVAPGDLFRWWTLVEQSNPLPIELIFFSAKVVGSEVELEWKTAGELNNDYFTIQRSAGDLHFANIGQIKGGGSSTTLKSYHFTDLAAMPGRSYYRLKQTDFDGSFKFSEVVKVDLEVTAATVTIFPNPTTNNEFSLNFHNPTETPTSIIIYDLLGREVFNEVVSPGALLHTIRLVDSPAGVYSIQIVNTEYSSQRVVLK